MLTQEVVNMGRTRRAFTQEFKREAVKLVTESGHPTAQVARDLGLTPNLLRRWKQEVAGDPVAAFPGKGRRKPHEEELARLKRDLARVTQERDGFYLSRNLNKQSYRIVNSYCSMPRASTMEGVIKKHELCQSF